MKLRNKLVVTEVKTSQKVKFIFPLFLQPSHTQSEFLD